MSADTFCRPPTHGSLDFEQVNGGLQTLCDEPARLVHMET